MRVLLTNREDVGYFRILTDSHPLDDLRLQKQWREQGWFSEQINDKLAESLRRAPRVAEGMDVL